MTVGNTDGAAVSEPLAIVGIGCRFPGDSDSVPSFWKLLCDGTDATRVVPETRWDAVRFWDPNGAKIGKIVTQRGGFLTEIDQFDPQFFGITPREAHSMDPQQRLLLRATWEALEDGGIPADRLAGTDVGVFVGGFTLDYQLLQNQGRASRYRFKAHSATGMMMTMLANRISFAFDLRGPSMAIDTACSSSLVAVHLAAQSIWSGECELALAGGVNIMIGPNTAIAESRSGFLSPEGRSKAFDDSADGYARGEGGAMVVIKPLARALADGDDIYAQILGTAVSQDGHTGGITVPREEAQHAAIVTALRRSGIQPGEVGYVEAHGTGTPVGDPIEMRALSRALSAERPEGRSLVIGSVKTNIGHLEAGAGVAGLIKAALVLKHGFIPANLHFQTPNSAVSLAELNLDIPAVGRPFPGCERRIAGVNSFGFGGTNAHVVLAEPPSVPSGAATPSELRPPVTVLPISARSEEALVALAGRLATYLDDRPETTLSDLGYTLSHRRTHLSHRHTLIAADVDEARQQLRALADGGDIAVERTETVAPKVAFVCTGMGPQWWGMCRGLLDGLPVFAESIARTEAELSRYADWSLIEELRRDERCSRMDETEIAQPTNFAVQIALAAQLAHFGITPDALVGHSAGEVAAHHLAGLLTFEQAVQVVYHRSRLQQRTSGLGRMLAVGTDADSLLSVLGQDTLGEFGRRVSVAAINSPSAVTIAGDGDVLDLIARQLDGASIFNRFLVGKVPYHTHYMDAVRGDLVGALEGLASKSAAVPLYSTVTGERLDGYEAGAAYWWQNTRATVLFEPAIRRLLSDGYTHFVELGPHPVLAAAIAETAGPQRVSVSATQRRNDDDVRVLLRCVGAVHSLGRHVEWDALNPAEGAKLIKLPTYPWQTKRFWNDTHEVAEALFYNPVHPLLGQPVKNVHPTWETEISSMVNPFLADHRVQGSVVVPGAVYVEMALAAARENYGSDHSVDNLVLHRAVILDDTCDPILRTTVNQADGTVEFTALTATAEGDVKWIITATAELNVLGASPGEQRAPDGPTSTLSGDEFYSRTEVLGFDYGPSFRSIRKVTAGRDWAAAELEIPDAIAAEVGEYRFHPALVDGAFQTLFGAPFSGQQESGEPFLPTRIRRCAVYGSPEAGMTVHVDVLSATRDLIECDITIRGNGGTPLAVFEGFSVQALSASSRMSPERIDKGLYEIHWRPAEQAELHDEVTESLSWLVMADAAGIGAAVADELRRRGHRVRTVAQPDVTDPTDLLKTYLDGADDLAGIVDFWPLDIPPRPGGDLSELGTVPILRLVQALAAQDMVKPRLHLVTGNAQPAPGTGVPAVQQSAVWGLGRVIGHQELAEYWGGLIDVDIRDDVVDLADQLVRHLLGGASEDQVAFRNGVAYVPRLQPCTGLTKPFPTKLNADATYLVTGGAGALGRVVATHLAECGARHITLMGRRPVPPRNRWAALPDDDPSAVTVQAIRAIERLGAHITTASVDVTDADAVAAWLAHHIEHGGRPVRGIIHAAGVVDDRLLVNMTDESLASVLSPKVAGTWALHDTFKDHPLDFFVLFGSAGSTIASPGQGNYAAANAFLDSFAHYRHAHGMPALTVGWGPWSVGMVEQLKLERLYAQRGIELITPAVGVRILDRLLGQRAAAVVAITADWNQARKAGLGGPMPAMFAGLQNSAAALTPGDDDGTSMLELLAATPEHARLELIAEHLLRIVAIVFDCAVADIDPADMLDDIGLDSMMAMEFRIRVNSMFSIDLPVLEILRGVSVNTLSDRVLTELHVIHDATPAPAQDDDVELSLEGLSDAELQELLAELEADGTDPGAGGV